MNHLLEWEWQTIELVFSTGNWPPVKSGNDGTSLQYWSSVLVTKYALVKISKVSKDQY